MSRRFVAWHCARRLLSLFVSCATGMPAFAGVNVLTYHNDFARTGQNTNETVLTPANVNSNSFGLLFSYPVDGQVYAQPLYVSGLSIPGQGTHNVLFVATMHDSVYAFDADTNGAPNGGLLWQVSLGTSAATPNSDFGNRYGAYHDIRPEVGIVGTPVIDLSSGTLYVDAFTHENGGYVHRLHALNILTGAEQPNSPVVVSAAISGTGVGSSGGVLAFDPMNNGLQRPALTLAGGIVYIAYSGFADTNPYHGWVLGFDARTLQQLTNYIFNTTPNSSTTAWGGNAGEGGLWMGGNGPSVDAGTNLYFMVANGIFNANTNGTEFADSFMRLATTNGLSVADYFTPHDQATLAANDTDLGSGGPVLLPDEAGSPAHAHLIVGTGKSGKIYLVDRDAMGGFNSLNDTQIVQVVSGAIGGVFSTPAYFNHFLYYQPVGDHLKVFAITNATLSTAALSQSPGTIGFPGATPSVSANGTNNAIVWVLDNNAVTSGSPSGPAVLHAFNGYNLASELYNSSQAGARDTAAWAVKTSVPTIANGKVYVGGALAVSVYGNASFLGVPVLNPTGGIFTNSTTVSVSESTPGASVYYTLDSSAPSTNSSLYTGPIVLTNTTVVSVRAFKAGYLPSPVVSGTFINAGSLSPAPDFLKQEFYSGATRANLEDPTFTTAPNFINYVSSFETPSGQGVNYAERVSGYFIAPVTTNYVFFVCSDDDSDLFLSTDSSPTNKHLIASETAWSNSRQWLSSAGGSVVADKRSDQFTNTAWPGGNTISLVAGTAYYIEGDHHQGGGGDDFAATFKFAGAPDPANGTAPTLAGNLISTYAYNNTYINITSPPGNVVAVQGTTARLSVGAVSGYLGSTTGSPAPALLYQWQWAAAGSGTFTNIPGATASSYSTPPLDLNASTSRLRVLITTAGANVVSPAATVTVVPSTTPPVPVQVVTVNSAGTAVIIAFSQPLDAGSAQTAGNYAYSPGNVVPTSVTLDNTGTNVTLVTATPLPQNTTLTLAVSNVQSSTGTAVLPGTSISFAFHSAAAGDYASAVLSDNPLAYWRLNETAGPTAFDATGAYNGTYGSAATPDIVGPRPPAFTGFESTNTAVETSISTLNSYVSVPFGALGTNTVTFTGWLYPVGLQENWAGLLMTRGGSGTSGGMGYNAQQMLAYTWNNNSSATYNFVSGLVIPSNQWSFVAMVIYPDKAILYLGTNGVLGSATNVLAHTPDVFGNNWQIGHDNAGGNATRTFNGSLDEVAVFTQSLSPARLAADYEAALQGGVVVTNIGVTPNALQFTSVNAVSGQVVLQWLGSGTLLETTNLPGPWSISAYQNNPVVAPIAGNRFYRLRH